MDLEEYSQLRKEIEQTQRQYDRSQGTLDGLYKRLEEYGVFDSDGAKRLLAQMEKQQREAEKQLEKLNKEWENKWQNSL